MPAVSRARRIARDVIPDASHDRPLRPITRALISVSDKTGLIDFARALGGSRRRAGLDRRHPQGARRCRPRGAGRLRAHRLSRNDGRPRQDAASQGAWRPARDPRQCRTSPPRCARMASRRSICWSSISIRSRRRSRKAPTYDDCVENIDIGGPAMIRAAAKNHDDVAVVVEPDDYAARPGRACRARRRDDARRCARNSRPRPIARTAAYDAAISNWFAASSATTRRPSAPSAASSPRRCATARTRTRAPRSIARPNAASASPPRGSCRASSSPTTTSTTPTRPLNASPSSIRAAPRPAPSSSTPTRAASPKATSLLDAYRKALACDPMSAFGGIVALNRTLDADAARAITEIFTEVIIAPDATDGSDRDRRRQEEPAPARCRRPARSARRGPDRQDRRRRLAGAIARQCGGRRHAAARP